MSASLACHVARHLNGLTADDSASVEYVARTCNTHGQAKRGPNLVLVKPHACLTTDTRPCPPHAHVRNRSSTAISHSHRTLPPPRCEVACGSSQWKGETHRMEEKQCVQHVAAKSFAQLRQGPPLCSPMLPASGRFAEAHLDADAV